MLSRLRIARVIGKRGEKEAEELLGKVMNREIRGKEGGIPLFSSDGLPHYQKALLEVYGETAPYEGRGRPPTAKLPPDGLQYGQVVKHRRGGKLVLVEERVIFGEEEEVKRNRGGNISTFHIERDNGTARCHNWRLTRKTPGYAKTVGALDAACAWTDVVYNFCRPHKALRVRSEEPGRKWEKRTPAMAAGLTDHIFSIEAILTQIPASINS